jgi:hypothetical protein
VLDASEHGLERKSDRPLRFQRKSGPGRVMYTHVASRGTKPGDRRNPLVDDGRRATGSADRSDVAPCIRSDDGYLSHGFEPALHFMRPNGRLEAPHGSR